MKSLIILLAVAFSLSGFAQEKEQIFLSANKAKKGIITTASGLQYEIITQGNGQKPTLTNEVKVHYSGANTDGVEFDSSYKRGEPLTLPMNAVIKGWQEGLQLMPTGSKYKFYIPSALAYGSKGAGTIIKPNETLIFEIELLEIIGIENVSATITDLHKGYTNAEIDKQMEENAKNPKVIEALADFNFMSATSINKTMLSGFGFKNITADYVNDLKNNPDDWTAVKIKHKKIAENYNDAIEENYNKWALFLDNCKTLSPDRIASGRNIIGDEKATVAKNRALIKEIFIIDEESEAKVFSLQKGDQLTYELKNEAGQVVTLIIVIEEIGNGQLKYNWKGLPPNPATGNVTISDNALKNASQYVNPFSGGKSPANLDNVCAVMLSKVDFLNLKNKGNTTLDLFSGSMNYTNIYTITPEISSIPAGNKEMHCKSGENKFKVLDNPDYPLITEMQMGKMKVALIKVQQ